MGQDQEARKDEGHVRRQNGKGQLCSQSNQCINVEGLGGTAKSRDKAIDKKPGTINCI